MSLFLAIIATQLNLTNDQLHKKGNIMNRSKLISATALATVMSATAAHAELSLSGFYAATVADADGGTTHGTSTSSMYVTYSDTLDNGMGIVFNIS
ncbi:uncharacterized protein METZ01_LOCUS381245, partial [marine metagenome]